MENDWKKRLGVVYSTEPGFEYSQEGEPEEDTLPPGRQLLYLSRDRKQRKGKTVTLVEGFQGRESDLKELGTYLKSRCGTGGSVKDGVILIQGDFRDRAVELLTDKGYHVRKKGG